MPSLPSVAFITLGCPKNEVDSDRMAAALVAAGFAIAEDPVEADAVVVNTCSFIQDATEASIATVLDVVSDWLPLGEERKLVVTGCMPSRYGSDLTEVLPEVSAFVPVAEENTLVSVLAGLFELEAEYGAASDSAASRSAVGPSAYLQIADGCHRQCSFCTIPAIRGPYLSRPIPKLVAEANELVALGAKEIVLIGQDTTSYGRDLGDVGLADVIRALARVDGVEWLRLMYAQPDGIDDRLLETMASHDNVAHYLDMPLQHASRPVLHAMRRTGDAASYLRLVGRIRTRMPDAALRTTVISGFPGETRADARALELFLQEAEFNYVGVFAFSAEEGTTAATMPEQVSTRTTRARAQRVRDLADVIGFRKVEELLGTTLDVLVERYDDDEGAVVGRWRGQAPEIDGLVLLDSGEPGQMVRARVVDALGYDVEAEVEK